MKAIILLGAPGCGKGTAAEDLVASVSLQHVSTGDMLRESIRNGSEEGLQARSYMEKGELVPDEVILRIVAHRLKGGPSDATYMFDGFPRTQRQAEMLDEILKGFGAHVSHVFLLEVARDLLVRRICGRRICRQCGAVYNIHSKRPAVDGVCDHCGSTDIYQRADDTEETLNNRLEVFENQTSGLIDYYRNKGILVNVDANDRMQTRDKILGVLQVGG